MLLLMTTCDQHTQQELCSNVFCKNKYLEIICQGYEGKGVMFHLPKCVQGHDSRVPTC